MTQIAALFAGAWAFLEKLWPTMRDGLLVWCGMIAEGLRRDARDNAKLADTYKQILEVEKANAARRVAGAAARLRKSGYTRKR